MSNMTLEFVHVDFNRRHPDTGFVYAKGSYLIGQIVVCLEERLDDNGYPYFIDKVGIVRQWSGDDCWVEVWEEGSVASKESHFV